MWKERATPFPTAPRIAKSGALLFELTFDSATKLVLEPPATVGLCLCSGAVYDVSYDFEFTAFGAERVKFVVGQDCPKNRIAR